MSDLDPDIINASYADGRMAERQRCDVMERGESK
jgi:hypothetical protein